MPVLIRFSIGLDANADGVGPHHRADAEGVGISLADHDADFRLRHVFQLPVVLTLLASAGIVTADGLVGARRYAIVGIFAAAAILTPPDALSMVIMALPTVLLYEASIYAVRYVERPQQAGGVVCLLNLPFSAA